MHPEKLDCSRSISIFLNTLSIATVFGAAAVFLYGFYQTVYHGLRDGERAGISEIRSVRGDTKCEEISTLISESFEREPSYTSIMPTAKAESASKKLSGPEYSGMSKAIESVRFSRGMRAFLAISSINLLPILVFVIGYVNKFTEEFIDYVYNQSNHDLYSELVLKLASTPPAAAFSCYRTEHTLLVLRCVRDFLVEGLFGPGIWRELYKDLKGFSSLISST